MHEDSEIGRTETTLEDRDEFGRSKPKGFTLHDLKMKVPHGALVAVVGETASGKTSLLHAILGEMPLKPIDPTRPRHTATDAASASSAETAADTYASVQTQKHTMAYKAN